jgi:ATP-dependent protease HslVU (ClpYQ) peptidase subunit
LTAIVGIQGKDGAVLASDSFTIYGDRSYQAKSIAKIVEKNGYTFAFAGDGTVADIAKHLWIMPKFSKTMDLDDFVMIKILGSLREACKNHGYEPDADDKDSGWDALICINGTIYQLDQGFGYLQSDSGLYAIGSGGATALGAMEALISGNESLAVAESIAIRAIEISTKYNINVGGDIQSFTQKAK